MRVIKFRAWSPFNKEMYYAGTDGYVFVIEGNGEIAFRPEFSGPECEMMYFQTSPDTENKKEMIVVMQYTGLRDKNGKEIYEGDIIKASVGSPDAQRVCWTVVFDAGAFQLATSSRKEKIAFITLAVQCEERGLLIGHWKEIEKYIAIIGNIHESPELIQQPATP